MLQTNLTIHEALNWASSLLEKKGRADNAGEILLMHILNYSRSKLLSEWQKKLSEKQIAKFYELITQHAQTGIPIQYLIGHETFFGRKFIVNENVLIPRPETEELIIAVLKHIPKVIAPNTEKIIADIGTGSGIIAITMHLEFPDAKAIYAVDISPFAMQTAKKNAALLGATNIIFSLGNLVEPLVLGDIKVNVVLGNLPYIPTPMQASLPDTVKNFEPESALLGGMDGLDFYRQLIDALPNVLCTPAIVAFEIGSNQGQPLAALFKQKFPSSQTSIIYDINKNERIILAEIWSIK